MDYIGIFKIGYNLLNMNQEWDIRIEGNENIKWLSTIIIVYIIILIHFIFWYIYILLITNEIIILLRNIK